MCPDGLAQAGLWQPQPAGSLVYTAGFLNAAVPMGMCVGGGVPVRVSLGT